MSDRRTPPTVVDREVVIPVLLDEFDAVLDLARGLADDHWDVPTCLPGWTVRDVVSHVIGTEAMLAGEDIPRVDVSHATYLANRMAEYNERWVETMRTWSGDRMLARLEEVLATRRTALEAMTQDDLDQPSWTPVDPDETYGRYMRIRQFDLYVHELDLRAALDLPPRTDDTANLALSLDEIVSSLGFAVGKKAALPPGTRVTFALTGPAARDWHVEVADRARLVDGFVDTPTVTIQIPAREVLAHLGGCDWGPSTAEISGDRDLGRHLLDNLTVMI